MGNRRTYRNFFNQDWKHDPDFFETVNTLIDDRVDIEDAIQELQNYTAVKSVEDFGEPIGNMIPVSGAYFFGNLVDTEGYQFQLEGDTQFIGINEREAVLYSETTGSLINGIGHSFNTKFLTYSVPSGSVYNLSGSLGKHFYGLSNNYYDVYDVGVIDSYGLAVSYLGRLARVTEGFKFGGYSPKAGVASMDFCNCNGTEYPSKPAVSGSEITYLSTFEGDPEVVGCWFPVQKGGVITKESGSVFWTPFISNNRFGINGGSPFNGFTADDVGMIVIGNSNQIDSNTRLVAIYDLDEDDETKLDYWQSSGIVNDQWYTIDAPIIIAESARIDIDTTTVPHTFMFTDIRYVRKRYTITIYAETTSNNTVFQFAMFNYRSEENPDWLEIPNTRSTISFRIFDNTVTATVAGFLDLNEGDHFRLRFRRVKGSGELKVTSGRFLI